jgi:hypothetical protein
MTFHCKSGCRGQIDLLENIEPDAKADSERKRPILYAFPILKAARPVFTYRCGVNFKGGLPT